jgi:hypothetical protein
MGKPKSTPKAIGPDRVSRTGGLALRGYDDGVIRRQRSEGEQKENKENADESDSVSQPVDCPALGGCDDAVARRQRQIIMS